MSKIWKKPIIMPSWVKVSINDSIITVEWPKWKLNMNYNPKVNIDINETDIVFSVNSLDDWNLRWLTRTLVNNLVLWVSDAFTKKLLVLWVWYTAKLSKPNELELALWYSHKVYFKLPDDIKCSMEKDSKGSDIIILNSIDKQLLGQIASDIRILRKPEPYKGKWIRYSDEVIKLKAGKAAKK